jgi:broad specificity phosphatase PhoE
LLSARLGGLSPTVIWSSEEPKAVETARIVASAFGVAVQATEGLEEHHRTGVGYFPTQEEFELAVEQFFCRRDQLVLGTETAQQALKRFTTAVDEVISSKCQDNIVVTHGTVMALYVSSVSGIAPMDFWRRLGMPSFVVLELPDMRVRSIVESVTA